MKGQADPGDIFIFGRYMKIYYTFGKSLLAEFLFLLQGRVHAG